MKNKAVPLGDFYDADRAGFIQARGRSLGNSRLTWLGSDFLRQELLKGPSTPSELGNKGKHTGKSETGREGEEEIDKPSPSATACSSRHFMPMISAIHFSDAGGSVPQVHSALGRISSWPPATWFF